MIFTAVDGWIHQPVIIECGKMIHTMDNSLIPLNQTESENWVNIKNFSRCAQFQQACDCCLESQPQHPLPLYFLMGSVVLYPVCLMMCLFSHGNSNRNMHVSCFSHTEVPLLDINAPESIHKPQQKVSPPAIYQVTLWEPSFKSPCNKW